MIDRQLESRIEDVKNLIRIWHRFYRTLAMGFDPESITPDREREFLEIKTTVAEKHEAFMSVIEHDHHIGQSILDMIKRTISLAEFGRLSAIEINKISIEWHDANILLHETLGSLEYRREKAANVNPMEEFFKKMKGGASEGAKSAGKVVKWLLILGILGAAGWAVWFYWDTIVEWPFVKGIIDWVKKTYQIK